MKRKKHNKTKKVLLTAMLVALMGTNSMIAKNESIGVNTDNLSTVNSTIVEDENGAPSSYSLLNYYGNKTVQEFFTRDRNK